VLVSGLAGSGDAPRDAAGVLSGEGDADGEKSKAGGMHVSLVTSEMSPGRGIRGRAAGDG